MGPKQPATVRYGGGGRVRVEGAQRGTGEGSEGAGRVSGSVEGEEEAGASRPGLIEGWPEERREREAMARGDGWRAVRKGDPGQARQCGAARSRADGTSGDRAADRGEGEREGGP